MVPGCLKKTGCRRRNVIKEDLEAEEDEASRSELHVRACGWRMGSEEAGRRGSNGAVFRTYLFKTNLKLQLYKYELRKG